MILYEGPSLLDGAPIVVIATGLERPSNNRKTGDMIQTWILRADIAPVAALKTGADASICGDCPLRDGRCYVNVGHAPQAIWKAYKRGNYSRATDLKTVGRGRKVRIGAYGDPAAVPVKVWRSLVAGAVSWTGYTHQWKRRPSLKGLVMASTETPDDTLKAWARGWRTFRVGVDPMPGEITCPSETIGTACADCALCKGTALQAKSILITPHGKGAAKFAA